MAKTLILSNGQWGKLVTQLKQDYGPSILAISWVTRRELGFTVRSHKFWENYSTVQDTRLDFYDDECQTMFILKYSHFLADTQDS